MCSLGNGYLCICDSTAWVNVFLGLIDLGELDFCFDPVGLNAAPSRFLTSSHPLCLPPSLARCASFSEQGKRDGNT